MKTLVIGTGSIGIIYGWALSLAGIDVTHLVRSGRKKMLEKSIPLDVIDSRKGYPKKQDTQYTPCCVENIRAEDNYELIILPLGIDKIETALPGLVAAASQALYLPMGTNWRGTQGIDKYLSTEQYILGFPQGGGTFIKDKGVFWLGNKVYLEEANGKKADNLNRLKLYFSRAGLHSTIHSNFEHFLWVNHATAMPFGPAMLKAGSLSAVVNDDDLLIQCYESVQEIFELCRLRGANPDQFTEQSLLYRLPPWLFVPGTRLFLALNEQFARPVARLANKNADQELKALYWAMMDTASEFGHELPTP
jgi:ketopantoate reductase